MKYNTLSITRIKAVYNALEELKDQVVFVGGAVVALYAEREIQDPRPTDDVDILVEILNYKAQAALDEKLRKMGFTNDKESGIACRYLIHGIVVDVMPTTDRSFGFDSTWYAPGYHKAIPYQLDDKHTIRILPAPYFLATKLEAFGDRGNSNGRTSQDFEDIVFVFENRASIWDEIRSTDEDLKTFILDAVSTLLTEKHITEWIYGHTENRSTSSTNNILKSLHALIS